MIANVAVGVVVFAAAFFMDGFYTMLTKAIADNRRGMATVMSGATIAFGMFSVYSYIERSKWFAVLILGGAMLGTYTVVTLQRRGVVLEDAIKRVLPSRRRKEVVADDAAAARGDEGTFVA